MKEQVFNCISNVLENLGKCMCAHITTTKVSADQRTKAVESFALENLETFQEECSGVLFKIKSPTRTK
jgi:hypothetical protein